MNFDRREVRLNGEGVKLTPTEYDLLKYMIENAGKVLTQKMLLTAVWGPAYSDQAQYLRVFVGQLRKKLEKNPASPRFILTDLGVGYRFCGRCVVDSTSRKTSLSVARSFSKFSQLQELGTESHGTPLAGPFRVEVFFMEYLCREGLSRIGFLGAGGLR